MYLLDTDICSYIMKRRHPGLIERIRRFPPRELKVSVVTVYELEYGARRSERYSSVDRVIRAFLENVQILNFNVSGAREAGMIRSELEAAGTIIGAYDLLIAGHARSTDATLVTNNYREFARVERLRVENWVHS